MRKTVISGLAAVVVILTITAICYRQYKNGDVDLSAGRNVEEAPGHMDNNPTEGEDEGQSGEGSEGIAGNLIDDMVVTQADGKVRITNNAYHSYMSLQNTHKENGFDLLCREDGRTLIYSYNISDGKLDKLYSIDDQTGGERILKDGSGVVYLGSSQDGEYGGKLMLVKGDGTGKQLLETCTWYELSPDQQWIAASGTPDKSEQKDKKIYFYSIKDESLTAIEGVKTPDDWLEFLQFTVSWSSNSRHILLGTVVVDVDSKKVEKDLAADGYSLSKFTWSPDGSRLCFRVQSSEYAKYSLPGMDFSDKISNKIGLYYANDNSVKYGDFTDCLVYSLMWNSDGGSIALTTVPIESADEFAAKAGEADYKYSPYWVDIKTVDPNGLAVTDIMSSYSQGSDVCARWLRSFSGGRIFFIRDKDGKAYLSVMDINNRTIKDVKPDGAGLDSIIFNGSSTFILDDTWLYLLDDGYEPIKLWERTEYGIAANDITIYPEMKKIVYVRYGRNKNWYTEICGLGI